MSQCLQAEYDMLKTTAQKTRFRAAWAKTQHEAYRETMAEVQVEQRTDFSKGHSEVHTFSARACTYTTAHT